MTPPRVSEEQARRWTTHSSATVRDLCLDLLDARATIAAQARELAEAVEIAERRRVALVEATAAVERVKALAEKWTRDTRATVADNACGCEILRALAAVGESGAQPYNMKCRKCGWPSVPRLIEKCETCDLAPPSVPTRDGGLYGGAVREAERLKEEAHIATTRPGASLDASGDTTRGRYTCCGKYEGETHYPDCPRFHVGATSAASDPYVDLKELARVAAHVAQSLYVLAHANTRGLGGGK
jgi:hypothetical protein